MKVCLILAVLLVLCPAVVASLLPLDETGWELQVAEPFNGKVFMFYDSAVEDNVWIELGYIFEEDIGINASGGDPIVIEFALREKTAFNYMPNLIIRDITISNLTGRMWNALHLQLAKNLNGVGNIGFDPEFIFDGPIDGFNPFMVSYDPFAHQGINDTPLKMDFTDGVLTGDDLLIGFRGSEVNYCRVITDIEEGDSFLLKVWPSIYVPEPATFILLAFGFLLLLPHGKFEKRI
jgi:hypothetical protein